MGLFVGKKKPKPPAPAKEKPAAANHIGPSSRDEEETEEQFEARIYGALLDVAASTDERTRSALGSCVLFRTPYASAPELVKDAIRDFIDAGDL